MVASSKVDVNVDNSDCNYDSNTEPKKCKKYCEPLAKVRAEILDSSKKPKVFCCGMGCEEVLCQYCHKQKGRDYRKRCHDKCLQRCRRFKVEQCGKRGGAPPSPPERNGL